MSMTSFFTNFKSAQEASAPQPDVLTIERLEQHFDDMDVIEQNQVRMLAHMQGISIQSMVERCILEGRKEASPADSIPMFSLMQ